MLVVSINTALTLAVLVKFLLMPCQPEELSAGRRNPHFHYPSPQICHHQQECLATRIRKSYCGRSHEYLRRWQR